MHVQVLITVKELSCRKFQETFFAQCIVGYADMVHPFCTSVKFYVALGVKL